MPETLTNDLIELLDEAAQADCVKTITSGVKDGLVKAVSEGRVQLSEDLMEPSADGYGRRLLHRDPAGRYSVVAMIWGEGQGTPIHDHGDKWCVECVYRGQILVTTYEIGPSSEPEHVKIRLCHEERANLGEAGALIPPHDYHVIENEHAETAVTIHVYGGDMEGCNVFEPVDGGDLYTRRWKPLSFDSTL